MQNNKLQPKLAQEMMERQLLTKCGHILKKEIQRWYEINIKDEAIDYYTSQTTKKVKGRILFRQISQINVSNDNFMVEKNPKEKKQQPFVQLVLNNKKIVYLFQKDKQRLDQLVNLLTMYKQDQKIQGMNRYAKVEALRYIDKNNYNDLCMQTRNLEQTKEFELIEHPPSEHSYYIQLMPESISQRNISLNKTSIQQNEDLHNINESQKKKLRKNDSKDEIKVQISGKRGSSSRIFQNQQLIHFEEDDFAKRQRIGKENHQCDSGQKGIVRDLFPNEVELEDKCMKFNDEITEVLSREETENTNRAQIFSKLYSLNDNFQIQKIKKQIQHSSNNLYKATQESLQEINIPKNASINNNFSNCNNNFQYMSHSLQDQYRFSTVPSPQSQLIKNPFSHNPQQLNISFKQLPTLPQTTTALGASFQGNSFRFNTLLDSNREHEQYNNYSYQDDTEFVPSPQINNDVDNNIFNLSQQSPYNYDDYPMYLSSTIRERIQQQQYSVDQQFYQTNKDSNSENQRKYSISEIESESNLASIKQLNCDIKSKHFLKDTMTLELQNQFKKQSYFFQEFNTLITMNTQYLGGSTLINTKALNQGQSQKKRDSLQTFINNRSQTLDQQSERIIIPNTPKKRDIFLQGSITSRSKGGNHNSIRQQFSNDCESQNQFGQMFSVIQENDGFSEDQVIHSDKDVDKVANLVENYSHTGRIINCFQKKMSSYLGDSPKRFPRQSNFNASFMSREKRDTESINSKNYQIQCQNNCIEDDRLLHSLKTQSDKFLMTRINQIPIEAYCMNKIHSGDNLLIDFDSEHTEPREDNNQQQYDEDVINASNNMLAIQKFSLITKTKSEQDSIQALSNRDHYNSNQALNSPLTPVKKENLNIINSINQQSNLSQMNLQVQNANQSFIHQQNSIIYSMTPNRSEINGFNSPTKYPKQLHIDTQMINHGLELSKRDPSAQSLKSFMVSKNNLEKAMKYVWDFAFTKAAYIFEDFNNQEDVAMIQGHIYMLLIQFLCSLKTDYAEKVCKLSEKGIDIILSQRAKNNQYLSLIQEMYLTEMYLIKGILQFSLDRKIQGLFSLKNAYKYYQKCVSTSPQIVSNLKQCHKIKITFLEGLNHLSKSTLQESFRRVLSFFGQTFDLEKGLKLLFQVAFGDQNNQISQNFNNNNNNVQSVNNLNQNSLAKDEKYQEYLIKTQESEESNFVSHMASVFLILYYVWREKNPQPVIKLINSKLKQFPSSPIYYWLSYLIQFERKENVKAINDINKTLSKSNQFKQQCLSFKFEKALFLTSNLLWNDALSILGQIGVQLLTFEQFKYDVFQEMLLKAKLKTNYFINFYRSNMIEYKPEKYFFIGISNLILTQAACLISQKNIDFAKEWLLLSSYFKKHSYLSGFMNSDQHTLCSIYFKRNNFTFVMYEIMYFTKTITKIPNDQITQILNDIEDEKKKYFKSTKLTNEEEKQQGVERSSYVFLRILIGCLQFDNKIIEESEKELESIVKYQNDKKFSDNTYLLHHSYYWICKFYYLQQQYDKVLKNIKLMQKYPSKIFCLSSQAENLVKLIQNNNNNVNNNQNKS